LVDVCKTTPKWLEQQLKFGQLTLLMANPKLVVICNECKLHFDIPKSFGTSDP
jgi:hypothetical protein